MHHNLHSKKYCLKKGLSRKKCFAKLRLLWFTYRVAVETSGRSSVPRIRTQLLFEYSRGSAGYIEIFLNMHQVQVIKREEFIK